MSRKNTSIFIFLTLSAALIALALYLLRPESLTPVSESTIQISEVALKDNTGCYACHGQMEGLQGTHALAGCAACHKGNGTAMEKEEAHRDMFSVPGNFSDMEQTCGVCHAESVHHITNSIMATNSGLVNVDRYIFGERDTPDGYSDIKDVGQSAADNHLRMLCARCHLGKQKVNPGPVTQLSRGGGCVACHSNYSEKAEKSHAFLQKDSVLVVGPHPTLSLEVSSDHCFGCHSRSGRISTNYEGWHETMLRNKVPDDGGKYRLLEDKRVFTAMQEDVHHTLGLQCIDCHVYQGVMGDGTQHMHEEDAVKIACEDCHFTGTPATVEVGELTDIDSRIYASRKYTHQTMLVTQKGKGAIVNSSVDEEGAHLFSKFSDASFLLTSPSASCSRDNAHQSISCSACHSAWAPQCAGCHVTYNEEARGYDLFDDKRVHGAWIESAGGYFTGLPAMGVYRKNEGDEVTCAIPGMIMMLDKSGFPGNPTGDSAFFRLYAPAKPHTTSTKGRSCTSCHANSLALGYGRGKLTFFANAKIPHWEFEPEFEASPEDDLPADAWIGFLDERNDMVSTRLNFTPFTVEEQQRILTVGACLTCHDDNSEMMMRSLKVDFSELLNTMSSECRKPGF